MRRVIVCPTDFLFQLFQGSGAPPGSQMGEAPLYIVGDARTRSRLARRGVEALAGALDDPAVYRRARLWPGSLILLLTGSPAPRPALDALLVGAPGCPVVSLAQGAGPPLLPQYPTVTTLLLPRLFREVLRPEMERACLRLKVERIRELAAGKERIGILLQDDPDPDALASGLALRALLGRTKPSAPLITFGRITRPENVAMVSALEIEVEHVTVDDLSRFDGLAMVDVQPSFCEEQLGDLLLVI